MKYAIIAMLAATSFGVATAQEVTIGNNQLGTRAESATKWDNNIYHAPQYMPGNPTAATLYPRVVDVPCTQVNGKIECKGYNWIPELGRGEYLMFRPVMVEAPKVVEKVVPVMVPGPVREVFIEVPVKKKKE